MIPSSILLATEGVAAAFLKVPQVLHAAFVESLTGWIVGLMAIVAGAIVVGLLRLLRSAHPLECAIEQGAPELRHGHCCRHRVPLTDLNLEHAAITDLSFDPGNQPRRRLAEPGCTGRNTGWYQLRNGARAIVFLGDPKNMVRIPTHSGYTLLLSVPEPSQLLERLRAEVAQIAAQSEAEEPSPEPARPRPKPKPKRKTFSNSTAKKQKKATTPMAIHERASSGVV